MNILIACEHSGAVRDAFTRRGHHAMSCDLLPSETPGPHHRGDVREILHHAWDAVIAFPDCTYLCGSGWHWVARGRICRIAGAGVDVAHDQAQSSTVAASLGLYDTAGKLGGQFNQAHEMVAYTKRGLALSFGMRA